MKGLGTFRAPAKLANPASLPSPFKLPKAPKIPGLAKIRQIKITPASSGGFHVAHSLGNGKEKTFVFSDPSKMAQHLKRIQNHEWLKPMQNPAPRIAHTLDLGETP